MAWEAIDISPRQTPAAMPVEVTGSGDVAGSNRRREYRRRVYKGATIKFNGGFCALQCVVVDLSPSGARLSFGDTLGVPASFEIRIAGEERWRSAEVRWRKPESIGIALAPAA